MALIQKALDFINGKSPGPTFALKVAGCKTLNPVRLLQQLQIHLKKILDLKKIH